MLITKEVEITLNSTVMPNYKKLGYCNLKKKSKTNSTNRTLK